MKPQPESSTQEVLAGLVERVTFHNAENGFCVLRAKARGRRELVTVIGHAAIISAGEWITANGPAPKIEPRFARIEIIETIALVHLEVRGWSGKLAGVNSRASDVFTLLKLEGEWKITHKLFHWHSD